MGSRVAATPCRSCRRWWTGTALPVPTKASSASSANCAARLLPKLAPSSSPNPAQEAQVDYGTGPTIRDPNSGKYRRSRLFVMTLGYSRKCVRLLTFQSSTRIWAELHERAFRKLGGAVKIIVPDNLREGVLKPDIYDADSQSSLSRRARSLRRGRVPCRVADPDRKGKVESGVGHAQKTPLKAQRFESMEEAQAYLDQWEERWADTRIHGTTKRQVAAMFAEEKPSLLPLPLEPFRYYQYGERTVHLDGCVEVEAAYYSAPPGWIGRKVQVQWDGKVVRLLDPSERTTVARTLARRTRPTSDQRRGSSAAHAYRGRATAGTHGYGGRAHRQTLQTACMPSKANRPCGAYKASCLSPKSMASPVSKMPVRRHSKWKPSTTVSYAVIWNAIANRLSVSASRSTHPSTQSLSRPHWKE